MNEYTSKGGVARSHSDNGNLKDNGKHTFVYDYKNRLIGAFDKATGNPTAAYLYYCDNRRAKKIVYSQTSPGVVERQERFFYDGQQVVEETDDAGNTLLTWVYSPVYVDEPVQMVRSAAHPLGAGTFYLHQNARADVVAVTDSAGSVVERRLFDDFGRSFDGVSKAPVSGSAVGNVYGFQGRRLDAETGLYYFRARYYDPSTGRFVQRDPVWDPGNFGNQYSFVGNGPVSGRDPSGLIDPIPPGLIPTETLKGEHFTKAAGDAVNAFWKKWYRHPLPRKFLDHYAGHTGARLKLSKKEMLSTNPVAFAGGLKASKHGLDVRFSKAFLKVLGELKKCGGGKRKVDFKHLAAALTHGTLGRFTVAYKGTVSMKADGQWSFTGKMEFKDRYDFNPDPTRSPTGEFLTRVGKYGMSGRPFYIGSERVDVTQKSGDKSLQWGAPTPSEVPSNLPKPVKYAGALVLGVVGLAWKSGKAVAYDAPKLFWKSLKQSYERGE